MKYFVYRKLKTGGFGEIAQTRYLEDAKAVLSNWAQGYIAYGGEIVFSKKLGI